MALNTARVSPPTAAPTALPCRASSSRTAENGTSNAWAGADGPAIRARCRYSPIKSTNRAAAPLIHARRLRSLTTSALANRTTGSPSRTTLRKASNTQSTDQTFPGMQSTGSRRSRPGQQGARHRTRTTSMLWSLDAPTNERARLRLVSCSPRYPQRPHVDDSRTAGSQELASAPSYALWSTASTSTVVLSDDLALESP